MPLSCSSNEALLPKWAREAGPIDSQASTSSPVPRASTHARTAAAEISSTSPLTVGDVSIDDGCPVPAEVVVTSPVVGSGSEEHTSELQSLLRISYAVF